MKKFSAALLIVLWALCGAAFAGGNPARIGYLARLNTTEEAFHAIISNSMKTAGWSLLSDRHELDGVHFYDSLTSMQMALDARRLDEIALPDMTAEYLLGANPSYEVCCVAKTRSPMSLAMGFRKDEKELRERVNATLKEMDDDWTLAELQSAYIHDWDGNQKPVRFETFEGAATLKVAVTGDLPPVDFIAADGTPAGFNTALLSELARRMCVNVKLVSIDSGARSAALASGNVDVIFWYETSQDLTWNYDAPENVSLSIPYYKWHTFLHLRRKAAD